MGNVNIKFNGKDYLLACDDGQEENLKNLGKHIDKKFENIKKKLGKLLHIGGIYNDIGNIYHHKHNNSKALEYYDKAIEIAAKLSDEKSHIPYGNKGNIYYGKILVKRW